MQWIVSQTVNLEAPGSSLRGDAIGILVCPLALLSSHVRRMGTLTGMPSVSGSVHVKAFFPRI